MAKRKAREIKVNDDWCKGCGICVAFCAPESLKADAGGIPRVVDLAACTLCMLCELRCPDFAIVVIEDTEAPARDVATAAHAG